MKGNIWTATKQYVGAGCCDSYSKIAYFTSNLPAGTVLKASDLHYKKLGHKGTWTDPKLTWNGLIPSAEIKQESNLICQDMVEYKGPNKPPVGQKLKWNVGKGQFLSTYDFEKSPTEGSK